MPETQTLFHNRVLALDVSPSLAALMPGATVIQASFADLDADMLAQHGPDLVLVPLMASTHDATHVIARLQALGFAGTVTVIGPHLPHPRVVEQELRRLGPGLKLTLLTPT